MCDVVCRGEGWCGWPVAIGILVLKAEKDRINLKRQRFMRGNMTWLPDEELGKQDKAAKDLGWSRKKPESIAQMAREWRWKLKKHQRYMNHLSSMRPGDDRLQVLAPVQRSLADASDEISRASEWEFKNSNNQMEGKNPQSLVQLALQYYVNLMEKKAMGLGLALGDQEQDREQKQNPLRQEAALASSQGKHVI